jgi:DNA-binding MarR family transcriptional regulator
MSGAGEPDESLALWLNDAEQAAWQGLLRVHLHLFDALDKQLREQSDLPHSYYMNLAILSEAPDSSLRISDLAERTGSSVSRTSHTVSALVAKGWVARCRSTDDRRGSIAQLTDDGFRVLEEAAPGHVREVRRLVFDQLSDSQVAELAKLGASLGDPRDGTTDDGPPSPDRGI